MPLILKHGEGKINLSTSFSVFILFKKNLFSIKYGNKNCFIKSLKKKKV